MTNQIRRALFALALCATAPLPGAQIWAAPTQIASKTVKLGAIVRNEQGAPVAGADVFLVQRDEGNETTQLLKTDAQGRFSLELPASKSEAFVEVFVRAPGLALQRFYLLPAKDNAITLKPSVAAIGKVVDASGEPVAGARVKTVWIALSDEDQPILPLRFINFDSLSDSILKSALETRTDANGIWEINDLPAGSQGVFQLEDPRFARADTTGVLGATAQTMPDLKALPGANLKGRVVNSAGKPVAGARISANVSGKQSSYASTKTAPDGTYSLQSLSAGDATIKVISPDSELAPTSVKGVAIVAKQTATAPDIKLGAGVLLSGKVLDKATKKPVEGARVMAQGDFGDVPSTATGKDGIYQLRVPIGQIRFYLYSRPAEYVRQMGADTNANITATSANAPDFAIERGLTLTGTARDESGAPAVNAAIIAGSSFDGAQTSVDAEGNWTLQGVDANPNGRRVANGKVRLQTGGDWEIAGDGLVAAREGAPINLTLRRIERQDVTLRVVTPTGEPVEGASVRIAILFDANSGSTRYEGAVTNARGEVTVKRLRPDESVEVKPTKEGYALQKAGVISALDGNKARATDAILTPKNGVVRGRIVDAGGVAVVGARVAVLWPGDLRDAKSSVQSDANGKFELDNLRAGEVIVGAARGRDFGQIKAQTGDDVEIVLTAATAQPAPENRVLARELLAQGFADAKESYTLTGLAAQMAAQEPENAAQFAEIVGEGNKNWFEQDLANVLAKRNPASAIELARVQFAQTKKPEDHTKDALDLAELLIQSGNTDEARELYQSVAPDAIRAARGATPNDVISATYRTAQLAGITGALRHPDAAFWLEILDRSIPTQPNDETMFRIGGYMEEFARSDVAGAVAFMDTLAPAAQVRAYEDVIPLVARRDLPFAQQLLAKMDALVARGDIPIEPDRNDAMYRPTPARSLNVALAAIVRALLPDNPRAAYEQTQKITADGYETDRLQIDTALQLPANETLPILREQFALAQGQGNRSASKMARLARLVAPLDAQLSEQWFEMARQKLAENWGFSDSTREMAAPYAFYRADSDPAQSRLLLENEWQRVTQKNEADDYSRAGRFQNIVWAMVPINWERALQMMREKDDLLGEQNMDGAITQRNFVTWLLASEQERREINFERPSTDSFE